MGTMVKILYSLGNKEVLNSGDALQNLLSSVTIGKRKD
jgi:hypothetical protein